MPLAEQGNQTVGLEFFLANHDFAHFTSEVLYQVGDGFH
jgi:hypothetical protein